MGVTAFFLIILVVVYLAFVKWLETKDRKRLEGTDEYLLSSLAMKRQCSTYQIFQVAGIEWGFSAQKIESDFNRYLKDMRIAPYVIRYVKEHVQSNHIKNQAIIHPPDSWST